jgi:hypothetical protein
MKSMLVGWSHPAFEKNDAGKRLKRKVQDPEMKKAELRSPFNRMGS